MREQGYYWVRKLKWSNVDRWFIAYWDGHYFWNDGDDFSQDCLEEIDEKQIIRE